MLGRCDIDGGGAGGWDPCRIAAIAGILKRTRVGWLLAVGFFVAIIALNLVAGGAADGMGAMMRVAMPVGCLVYLLIARSEFD